jgi:hypothetical protein
MRPPTTRTAATALIAQDLAWLTSLELYLPEHWAADDDQRARAQIPRGVAFREKWRIAVAHVRTVLRAGFGLYHGDGQMEDQNLPASNDVARYSLSSKQIIGLAYPITPFLATAPADPSQIDLAGD